MVRRILLAWMIGAPVVLFALLVISNLYWWSQFRNLEALVGTPSSDYSGEYYSSKSGDWHGRPAVWDVIDGEHGQNMHLRALADVSEETLTGLGSLNALELKLLGEDSFWDFYRLEWLEGDLDQDGIPNRKDACPDISAPGDPVPIYLKSFKDQLAWFSANYDFVENNLGPDDLVYNPYRRRSSLPGGWYEIPGSNDPPPAERHNLYYGCPEESDDDHDGVANYRDMCPGTIVPTSNLTADAVIDHQVVRGPRSLFPKDQGCTKSQLAAQYP